MNKLTITPLLLSIALSATGALSLSATALAEESLTGELSSAFSTVSKDANKAVGEAVGAVADQTNGPLSPQQVNQEQQHLLKTADATLQRLYQTHPDAKAAVEKAYGYAVFTATGVNLVLYVGGAGKGVAIDNATKKPLYMRMVRAGTGPGVGYEDFRQVLIFANKTLYDEFTTVGFQGSASANATVKLGGASLNEGKAIALVPGVSLYQLTDEGIDIQANWGGTEYLRDPELN